MPGTVVRDALAPNLLTGATLNAAGTTNGTLWEAEWPEHIQFELVTGTVTGTTPSLTVEIQTAENSSFTGGTVSTVGTLVATTSSQTVAFSTHVDARYVRARVIVAGTSPVFTGSVLTPVLPHDRRVRGVAPTAKALA